MTSRTTFVAHRHFPGPATIQGSNFRLLASTVHTGDPPPAVYQIFGCSRGDWKKLWSDVVTGREFRLIGPTPHENTCHVVLVFVGVEDCPPICLSSRLVDRFVDGFCVAAHTPPLSWRLAAVDFGRNLPTVSAAHCDKADNSLLSKDHLKTRQLRLRPDLAGPATMIAPTDGLAELVVALRSGFFSGKELIDDIAASTTSALSFLTSLCATGIVVDAPTALESKTNPFDFLGLHWSAHDPLVRRRYRDLLPLTRSKATDEDTQQRRRGDLEHAFDVLHRPETRRQLRHEIVQPPTLGEVTAFFHRRLRAARRCDLHDSAIDLCRRILELDPGDIHARSTLRRLLCHNHPYRP